jgi:F-type H+-transporting ATPase subunit b
MNNGTFPYRKAAGRFLYIAAGVAILLVLMAPPASAASGEWRPVYDKVMLWVNFFILAFIIVKYGRKPLMNFLNGQKDEIADQIHRLQKEKNALEAKIQKAVSMIEDSNVRFEEIKTRIIADGERARQEIIENATAQSKNIIEAEKLKASNQIVQAKARFMSELVDEASSLALSKLPAEITDADQEKLQEMFIANIPRVAQKSA